ncbi:MAG: cytochrome c [Rhodobacteraceae bacterium]|nr:cytochrome c [Paracoccaceae bacterium]
MKVLRSLALSALVAGLASAALSDPAGDAAVGARQSLMRLQTFFAGQLGQMAQGKVPYDAKMATIAANDLEAVTSMDITPMFPAGTDNGAYPKSHALPAIWTGMDDFMSKYADMHKATLAMQAAAGGGLDGLKAAAGPVFAACGACHKEYRAPLN